MSTQPARVAVVIPARDEAARVAATVRAAGKVPAVDLVVVVDDGSRDATAVCAQEAGAVVVGHHRPRGKAAALATGAQAVSAIEARENPSEPRHLLFLDADLAETAARAEPLVRPVLDGTADLTIAVMPPQTAGPGGGHGFVVRLARAGIDRATGWQASQPLCGQRCLSRPALDAAGPLARGFGVEVGMTIDLLRRGFRVAEVPVDFQHRVTGADLRGQLHRGRQWLHVAEALARRGVVPLSAVPTLPAFATTTARRASDAPPSGPEADADAGPDAGADPPRRDRRTN
ncbi:Glycosyl transferase family 2 [Actinopolymorpha cephalotaxi]|nr:glycosyltransferase [Actinopolymorpha cephalotaxi]SFG72403.1 Glycosyl transferase family 2 [Actinopolymorpha cephalotaxi]